MPYRYRCHASPPHLHCPACLRHDLQRIIDTHFKAGDTAGDDEPQAIYRTFFSPAAVRQWQLYFRRWVPKIAYATVFPHQRPYCTFSTPPPGSAAGSYKCEVGDLLLVVSDVRGRRRKAALLQAKDFSSPWPPRTRTGQWELYTGWPDISYNPNSGSSTSSRVTRSLPFKGGSSPAAQYLIIDLASRVAEASEALPVPAYSHLAAFVDDFLNKKAGRPFSWDRASARDDWDELVWDLLECTWKQSVSSHAGRGAGGVRGGGGLHFTSRSVELVDQVVTVDATNGQGPPRRVEQENAGDVFEGWGMPIVHLVGSSSEPPAE